MFFHFLSKNMEMAPWLGQGTECNKWLIAKLLSLNNPSLQHITLFEGNLPQNDTEIERGRERKKERKRASWMPNAMVTAGNRAPQVEFPSSVLPGPFWMCTTAFAWFTSSLMDCRVWSQVIAFGGGLSLYSVSFTSLTTNSCNTKVVFNHFDRGSYVHNRSEIETCSSRKETTVVNRKPNKT